jgi:hypothetical protein
MYSRKGGNDQVLAEVNNRSHYFYTALTDSALLPVALTIPFVSLIRSLGDAQALLQ